MSKTWKRLLSLALAVCMILSLGMTGYADDGEEGTISLVPEEDQNEPAPAQDGEALESYALDPDTLHVPKLGQEDPEAGAIALIDGEDAVDLNEVVRVSIFLDEPCALEAGYTVETAAEAGSYRDGLRARQDALTAQIESVIGHPLVVHWNLTLAVNAISAELSLGEMEKVAAIPGVSDVQRENRYLPMEGTAEPNTANTSENMVGAVAAWNDGYTGAGSRVAIIDTGIDPNHQSFNADAFDHAIDETGKTVELMDSIPTSGLNGAGVRFSDKIPYGYNYIDKNTTIDHSHDTAGNHGSHVAGIAAANRFIKNGSSYVDAASTVGAVGMAPDAQLLIMKVFGSGGGAYDSDYMVAIEDAIVLGADVVNLSLGSAAPGFTFSDTTKYQNILNSLASENNEKMVVSISAGNSYDFASFTEDRSLYIEDVSMHTGGSPGSFVNSLCVAAAQNTLTKGMPMLFNNGLDVYYYESTGNEEDGTTYTNPELVTIKGEHDFVFIDGTGTPEEYSAVNSAVNLSEKVVLVKRGDISFSEKGNNAKDYSPAALIVCNNADGSFYMNLADFTGTFPMVGITKKDAELIIQDLTAQTAGGVTYYTGSMEVTDVEKEQIIDRSEATITDFSSWGVPGSLLMKPEITAPGGDIYSVNGTSNAESGSGTDQYVSYSGTSMAAPHITGLTGVLAQYLRENPIGNSALERTYNTRAIMQSLLMSTATPMKPGGVYLPILQQGAGLADVYKAIHAASVLMITDDISTLTVKTGAADDGKVKAEFGDDPEREGVYSYSFTLYNRTDTDQVYSLSTDLFTQDIFGDTAGRLFMAKSTMDLDAGGVTYTWSGAAVQTGGHDVDMDGDTDRDDAQAILDYITGKYDEVEDLEAVLDLSVADLDEDEFISSQDAYLLLGWVEQAPPTGYVLPANGSADVTVTITLSQEDKEFLDEYYTGGAYIQGFTYVSTGTATREGESLETRHSIPLLGFYGSWTDATMFDTSSYAQNLYETGNGQTPQTPYSGTVNTNYLRLQLNGANTIFTGNPYMVEEEFPADRLAINSNTKMVNLAYNLIRSAGTTGYAVSRVDADGQITQVISSADINNGVTGQYYYVNGGSWQNTTTKIYSINKTPADYGLASGDLFRVGYYAVPEYYAMEAKESYDAIDSGNLKAAGFESLLEENKLGRGAFVGYDFVVDDTDPQIGAASLNGTELTVSASDNAALAYVAVLSLDGSIVYNEAAPGRNSYSVTFDASDAIANANGYVAVFAGDYAGNEVARAIKVNENAYEEKTVYVLTDSLTANHDYLIVNRNTAGNGYALSYTTSSSWPTTNTVATSEVTVKSGNTGTGGKPYIESSDAAASAIWTSSSGIKLQNGSNYLRRNSNSGTTLTISTTNSYNSWQYSNSQLRFTDRATYLRFSNNSFSLTTTASSIYIYEKTIIRTEVDPYAVSGVTVTPDSVDIYKGDSADLTAKVVPLTVEDRSVTWSSSNEAVATVDASGHVTGVAAGTAIITATASADETKSGSCTVTVVAINKTLNAIVWDEKGGVYFSNFNANSLPTWNKLHNEGKDMQLHGAFMQSTSALYAATLDSSSLSSTLYTVNRNSYALTEVGENFVGAMDLTRGLTSSTYSSYAGMVYCFGPYLVTGNYSSRTVSLNDGSSFTGTGIPYGMSDLSETTGAYIAGVAAESIGSTSSSYYVLDENGVIWKTTLSYNSSEGFVFSTPTKVLETGISTSFMYQSLYYDGTWLYWGHQADDYAELIVINPSTGKVYHAGNFGENVWPVVGIYVNGSTAPASVGEDVPLDVEPTPVATRDELLTQDVLDRFAAAGFDLSGYVQDQEPAETPEEPVIEPVDEPVIEPVEEPAEEPAEEPVEEPVIEPVEPIEIPIDDPVAPAEETDDTEPAYGSLQIFRGPVRSAPVQITDKPMAEDGDENGEEDETQVTITIAESEPSHNGMISFTYDPEALTYKSMKVNEDLSAVSVFVDDNDGKYVITIAYANRVDGTENDLIPAGTSIVDLSFTVGCEDGDCEKTTLERNEDLDCNEIEESTIPGAGHLWGEPEWTWAEDYTSAVATFTCQRNSEHTKPVRAEITSETANGVITYTATVEFEEEEYTDVQTVQVGVTVTFDLNTDDTSASVDPTEIQVVPGQPVGALPEPTRDKGWKFLGWYTEAASGLNVTLVGTKITEESVLNEETTLYAHWRLPGDVNGDGKVNALDVSLLSKYIRARGIGVTIVPGSANIDGSSDGKVNALDVSRLSKYIRAHGEGVVIY